jgi:hypothetical protein
MLQYDSEESINLTTCEAKYPKAFGYLRKNLTRPIFLDEYSRKKLESQDGNVNFEGGEVVKIRKSFRWQLGKALTRFGTMSPVAFSVTGAILVQPNIEGVSWWVDLGFTVGLGLWTALSIFYSSTYKESNELE